MIEQLVIPVATEFLKNAAVSAVKFFRDRGKGEEEAKKEAKESLLKTKNQVELTVQDIIGSALSEKNKDEFKSLIEDSVSQLPIQEGLAIVTIARYCEIPVYRVQQTEQWMDDSTIIRTAMNHAWIESRFEHCLKRLGYGIEKGRQLKEGVVNLWLDIASKIPREPSHRIYVSIICTPDPNDYIVSAHLYDMSTANILQEKDWFFLATNDLFNQFTKGIIERAKSKGPYAIATVEAPQIKTMLDVQEDPDKLYKTLSKLAGA